MKTVTSAITSPQTSTELRALAEALGGIPAPCQMRDADDWSQQPHLAAAACQGCHGLPECDALAVALGDVEGVWAGRDRSARRKTTRTHQDPTRRTP
jgi:hypothetical protein